ncbi:MAG: hypothetical protein WC717_03290 [Candidatus Micrarchaeia archaeon]|jgi:vacuolar-type H+-ATPase subunit H
MLKGILNFFVRKKPPARAVSEHRPSGRHESILKFSSQLSELRDTVTDKNVHIKAKEFYALVKMAFREALGIKYEVTFQEIMEEILSKKHFSPTLREEVNAFLDELAMMEYGYEEFRKIAEEKRHEQEKMLKQYISELESEGDRIKGNTKKKISEIVSESVPHNDREFLLSMADKFKVLVHQVF